MSITKLVSACCVVTAALIVIWGAKFSTNDSQRSEELTRKAEVKAPPLASKRDLSTLPGLNNQGNGFELFVGLKDIFDALILQAGEKIKDSWKNVAKEYCSSERLSDNGCKRFADIFGRYIDYKLALSTVESQSVNYSSAQQEIEYRISQINRIKYQFFSSEEIQILFGAEDEIEANALARFKIAKDQTLSQEQKQALLQHHFDSMSEGEIKAFLPSLQIQSIQKIKQLPTSHEHKLALVRAQFGDDAASRLAATWEAQSQFKQRVQALKSDYQLVAKQNQQTWLEMHFSKNQAKRARVLLEQNIPH